MVLLYELRALNSEVRCSNVFRQYRREIPGCLTVYTRDMFVVSTTSIPRYNHGIRDVNLSQSKTSTVAFTPLYGIASLCERDVPSTAFPTASGPTAPRQKATTRERSMMTRQADST